MLNATAEIQALIDQSTEEMVASSYSPNLSELLWTGPEHDGNTREQQVNCEPEDPEVQGRALMAKRFRGDFSSQGRILLDSGCSHHMFQDHRDIADFVRPATNTFIGVANSTTLHVTFIGILPNLGAVMVAPGLMDTLISISQLASTGKFFSLRLHYSFY